VSTTLVGSVADKLYLGVTYAEFLVAVDLDVDNGPLLTNQ